MTTEAKHRSYALIATDIWNDQRFLDLDRQAQLTYFAMRSVPTTNRAGISALAPVLWMTSHESTEQAVAQSVERLYRAGFVVVDRWHREVFIPDCIRDEEARHNGNVLERVIRDATAVSSELLRSLIVVELRKLGTARSVLAADCMEQGLPIPEGRRVSQLSRDDLKSLRRQFSNCPGRRRLRAEIDAGLHTCVHCGVSDRAEVDNRTRFLQVDHKVSLAMGGPNAYANYQVLCSFCNNRKGATG